MNLHLHSLSVFLTDLAWGWPLVGLLIGGGIYLFFVSKGLPLSGFVHAIKLISGKVHHAGDDKAAGRLSHFKALMNAIAATVGLGNIGGVAAAISTGGPGAVFWMWIAAFLGMNTKFFECTLSVMYRGKDHRGVELGGPMYVIESALPKKYHWLAYLFAAFGLLGCLAMYNVNQLTDYLHNQYTWPREAIGLGAALVIGYILLGGLQRIANFTSAVVPTMCIVYVVSCLIILLKNYEMIAPTLWGIVEGAFTFGAIQGGAIGLAFREILIIGVKRAAFSNEAGIGTAPMAHGDAKTSEPISEGLVAMLGPFIDTLVICTMTALVILISFPEKSYDQTEGVLLTLSAFQKNLPIWGGTILGLSIILFSLTTMVGMANYNKKCWDFLFKGRWGLNRVAFVIFFTSTLFVGALFPLETVLNFLDAGLGFMAFPNMLVTLMLSPGVITELKKYMKLHLG